MIDATMSEAVVWHEVECGGYAADLPLWAELAADAGEAVLELGCGSGRVALDLARRGHAVSGLDDDESLLTVLRERAAAESLDLAAHRADARDFDLERAFGLVLAPMQLAQLLDAAGRRSMLAAVARHLAPGGRAAFAITAGAPAAWRAGPGTSPPSPDVREVEGWIYSSLPLGIVAGADSVSIRRLRQVVSPGGALREAETVIELEDLPAEAFEAEGLDAGLEPVTRHEIEATDDHLGSVVVILEADP